MTNHSATGAVRRAGLALCTFAVFALGARTSFADPPPKPYFVVINDSTRTISGKFEVEYYPKGIGTSPETVVLEGSIGPRGSLRRNLPDQIDRAKESDARTARIVGAGFHNGYVTIDGGNFRFILGSGFKVYGTAALGATGGSVTVKFWVEHPTTGDPEHVTMIVTLPSKVQ